MILPEEDRRSQLCPPQWNGSYRWFRSPNVVDLWDYAALPKNSASSISCGDGNYGLVCVDDESGEETWVAPRVGSIDAKMALLSCTSRMTVDMPCGMAWSQFETVITMENF